MLTLAGLFATAFLAATLLPAQSEALLAALLVAGHHPPALLLATATAGNVLGALVTWAIGRFLADHAGARWFPASPERLEQAAGWYRRWGPFSLLLSWAPVIGDALVLASGLMRAPLWQVAVLVTLAKAGRYLVLAAAVAGLA